ncbi:MAG TPA: Xaa-Pro peptidase family protein [Terriglobia bacterium]|nr:Xaa-Pro peptidase family protein [Terriglobia bacterium]
MSGTVALPEGPGGHDRLQPDWYRSKIRQIQAEMAKNKLDAFVLLDAHNIIYATGYFHLSTERPLAALIPKAGDPVLFVPELEADQVKLWWVKDYESYFDYPGPVNRIQWIFGRIARRGFARAKIGIEEPTVSRLKHMRAGAPGARFAIADELVEHLRWVKDDDEITMMRRAMYFADFTVQAGRDFVARNGSVTVDQILKARADAVADKMSKELKDVVGVSIDPPFGGLVPFGKRSAFPHAVPSSERLKKGDALILSFGAQVGGYNVECERSFSVGQPSDYARRLFDAMLAAHDEGARDMKDGAVAEDVDRKALAQIRKAGFGSFLRHRTGHGIGLEGHESPWIAEGDKTVLATGMTFSCEPGVYDPNFGGFRHSDTVVVRKSQGEILNQYPTRLDDMIIEI